VAGTGPKQHFHDVEANLAGDLLQMVVVWDGVRLLVSFFICPFQAVMGGWAMQPWRVPLSRTSHRPTPEG
jgi:hypothetical protein